MTVSSALSARSHDSVRMLLLELVMLILIQLQPPALSIHVSHSLHKTWAYSLLPRTNPKYSHTIKLKLASTKTLDSSEESPEEMKTDSGKDEENQDN